MSSNKQNTNITLPKIGARIIKSAVGVALCMVIYAIRGYDGAPFYSALAVLWCMQPYTDSSKSMAKQRIIGTFIGALFALAFLLVKARFFANASEIAMYLAASVMIVPIIYTTVLVNKKNASFFSCVVFLSIAINHGLDANPYLFVLDRVVDTLIGIAIGVGMNVIRLPRKYRSNTLFVSGIDDILISGEKSMTPYSRIELNRLIDRGCLFTVSTQRTPAVLLSIMDGVRLKLPVIAMDGAVLYDPKENRYLDCIMLAAGTADRIMEIAENQGLHCFINALYDNTVIIYYGEFVNPAEEQLFNMLRRSPYRNYTRKEFRKVDPDKDDILYIMILTEEEKADKFYRTLSDEGLDIDSRITINAAPEFDGFVYIKIYNPVATRAQMLFRLKERLKPDKTVTLGSIEGAYDVYIDDDGGNSAVKTIKRLYEPYFWQKDNYLN